MVLSFEITLCPNDLYQYITNTKNVNQFFNAFYNFIIISFTCEFFIYFPSPHISIFTKKHLHAQYFDRFLIIDTITNFYRIKGYLHKKTSNYDTRNWRFNFQHNKQIIDCECRSYFYFSKAPIRMWLRKQRNMHHWRNR